MNETKQLQQFKELLKRNKYKNTPERRLLFETMLRQSSPCSIQELIDLVKNSMNETTVYRNLETFEEIGAVTRVYSGWRYKLELSDMFRGHHHHMTCRNCGDVISFDEQPSLLAELHKIEQKHGFTMQSHSLELEGLCSNCC